MTQGFTAKEIVSIIAACHKSRVTKVRWGELHLDFHVEGEVHLDATLKEPLATDIDKTLKAEDPFVGELEKQTLLMEDPAEFERQLMEEQMEASSAIHPERSQLDVPTGRHFP
jgi:hypothetical protein